MKPELHVGIDARVLGERGVGRYLSSLLEALAEIPGTRRFTLFTQAKSKVELVPKDPRFEIVALEKVNPAWAEQFLIPRLAKARGVQVLHYPDNTGAMRPGLPMLLSLHDSMWKRPIAEAILHPSFRQRVQDAYRKWVCPRAAKAAEAVVTVSKFSARELDGLLHLGSKLSVVSNAVSPNFLKRLPASKRKKLLEGLELKKPFVFCSGAADRRKNISRMIEAFAGADLKRLELVVTSLRPGEKESTDYETVVRRLGLGDRVRFLGFVSEEELLALYQSAEAYLFPSLWEGFGLPILEAYASQCPVLAARAGALPEVAGKAALLVDPTDVSEMALGLKKLLRAPRSKWSRLGKSELRRFSWARSARKILNVYERLAGVS